MLNICVEWESAFLAKCNTCGMQCVCTKQHEANLGPDVVPEQARGVFQCYHCGAIFVIMERTEA